MNSPQWNDVLVQFGIGAFETMRWSHGRIPLMPWHRQRLQRALLRWGQPENALDDIWDQVETQAALIQPNHSFLRVKLLIGLNGQEELIHHLYAVPFEVNNAPRRLFYCQQVTYREQRYKSTQYEDHYLNLKRAQSLGYDDVIYLDAQENVLESRTAAILFSKGDQLCAVRGPTLASSSVQSLLDRYPKDMITCPPIKVTDRPTDTHWFTCNALQGISPIASMETSSRQTIEFPRPPENMLKLWNHRLFPSPALPSK